MDKLNDEQEKVMGNFQKVTENLETTQNSKEEPEVVDLAIDEEEAGESKRSYLLIALGSLVIALLIGLGLMLYRYAPLNAKISGTWIGDSVGAHYKIENKKGNTTFTMIDANGTYGMDMIFKSKLTKEAANEYFVTDTKAYIRLNYEALGVEAVQSFKDNKEMFKVVEDNKTSVLFAYKKAGIEASFGDKDLNSLFKYVLRDFRWSKMTGETLNLRNDLFASGGISFRREE